MILNLSLILFVATLAFIPSTTVAQSSGQPSLSTQVYTPRNIRPGPPVLKKDAIIEEDLQERPTTAPSWVISPEPGRFTVVPGIREEMAPAEAMAESETSKELGLGSATGSSGEAEEGAMAGAKEEIPSRPPAQLSLIAKITSKTAPRRAASLRLTEEGRLLLDSGEYERALQRFEKTIAIDSTNAYSYYYLALAHHHLTHYQQSTNFLDVAESLLSEEPYWLAQVFALKGKNLETLGSLGQADASYVQALQLDPNNQTAFEGITEIKFE